jgi:uncharacterized protein
MLRRSLVRNLLCAWAMLVAVLLLGGGAQAQFVEVPPLTGRVIDQTGVLGPAAPELEATLRALEAEKGSQVVVLVLRTTNPETIDQFSIRVVEQWKLGRKGIDDGALLIVALEDRAVRIEVGRGLEGDIPDVTAKRIIEEQILPHFRLRDVPGGIRAGADAIVARIKGMELPEPVVDRRFNADDLVVPFFMAFFLGSFSGASLGRIVGALVGVGVGTGIAALMCPLVVAIPFGLLCGTLVFFANPSFMQSGSGYYGSGRGRYRGDYWRGGSGGLGGGFGGGFGGGGFGGGGGGFSGGGASGRW